MQETSYLEAIQIVYPLNYKISTILPDSTFSRSRLSTTTHTRARWNIIDNNLPYFIHKYTLFLIFIISRICLDRHTQRSWRSSGLSINQLRAYLFLRHRIIQTGVTRDLAPTGRPCQEDGGPRWGSAIALTSLSCSCSMS